MTNEEIERLKEVFVTRKDCDSKEQINANHFLKLEVATARVGTKLSVMMAILSAIGVAIAAAVVKIIFGG